MTISNVSAKGLPVDTDRHLTPPSEAEERLEAQGFTHEFRIQDDKVVHDESGTGYEPEDLEIVETHRNEGNTDPSDESLLFALEAPDGTKGVLVTNYGPDAPDADVIRRLGGVPG